MFVYNIRTRNKLIKHDIIVSDTLMILQGLTAITLNISTVVFSRRI